MVLLTKFHASNPFLNPNNVASTHLKCLYDGPLILIVLQLKEIIQIGSFLNAQHLNLLGIELSVLRFDSTSIQPIHQALEIPTTLISLSLSGPAAVYSTTWNLKFKIQAEIFDLGKIPRRPRRAQQWTDFVGDGELVMVFGSEVDILRTQTTALVNARPTRGHQDARLLAQIAHNFIISLLEPDDDGGVCGEVWQGGECVGSGWGEGGAREDGGGVGRGRCGCWSAQDAATHVVVAFLSFTYPPPPSSFLSHLFLHFGLRQPTTTTLGLPYSAGLPLL
ncbi:hypothetical protein C8F04DRAFT_1240581 [Mycena alexandri]|uniref:Uncharacterized protein n=1 Tax=Mycena alexandri TaxID=1745969 RepID=A0AAD6S9Z0_9AGAR|nr:hypothetical protein C8F04DRAFT_1240581 [Mycena alexandri]